MGMSSTQMLVHVELPLALPSILAGLRIATVTTIGLPPSPRSSARAVSAT